MTGALRHYVSIVRFLWLLCVMRAIVYVWFTGHNVCIGQKMDRVVMTGVLRHYCCCRPVLIV
jgi:hypothetical protein